MLWILIDIGPTIAQRPGATIILSSSSTILQPYSQVSLSELSTTSGLQCNGDTGSARAFWMIPDATILEDNSSPTNGFQVRSNATLTEANVELLRSAGAVISDGVFWCIVEYDSYTDMFPIWILSSSCKWIIINAFQTIQ